MKNILSISTALGLLLSCATLSFAQAPNFVNGGFEAPAVGLGGFQPGLNGSGWGSGAYMNFFGISSNASWITQYNPVAPEGTQVAFLSSSYSVVQSVSLPVGSYYITLKTATGPDYTGYLGNPAGVSVMMDGTTLLLNSTFAQGDYAFHALNTTTFTIGTPGTHVFVIRSNASATLLLDDVKLVANNALPTVSITAPTSGQAFAEPVNIALAAQANDSDGVVRSVQFYSGTTPISPAITSPPYTWSWTNAPPGQYTITAKAVDNLGGVTVSSPVTISTVAEGYLPLPAVTLTDSGGAWNVAPSDPNSGIFANNQGRTLSSYGAVGQYLKFQASIGDVSASASNNIFAGPASGHVVVALNHHLFFLPDGTPWFNQFIGVAFGDIATSCNTWAGPVSTNNAAVAIEWTVGNSQTQRLACMTAPAGTGTVTFEFTAMANGCAQLTAYGAAGQYLGTIAECHPDLASDYAGIGVGALPGSLAVFPYQVGIHPLDQRLIYPL